MLCFVLGSRFPLQSETDRQTVGRVCTQRFDVQCVLNFVHVCNPTHCLNFHNWPQTLHDIAPLLMSSFFSYLC